MTPRRNTKTRAVIVLCADDFAFTNRASVGIAELIRLGRLTATTCMTIMPGWPNDAALLTKLDDKVDIGLHLTLTDERPLTEARGLARSGRLPPFHELVRCALLGRLPAGAILAEFDAQVDRFEQVMGRLPAFVDGHQHIQQLPQIRDTVVELYNRRFRGKGVYIRNSAASPITAIQRRVDPGRTIAISALGNAFRQRISKAHVPTNPSFAGVYDFSDRRTYRDLFRAFLKFAQSGMILMCHPGIKEPVVAEHDPIARARARELEYLSSSDFTNDLSDAGVALGRFSDALKHLEHAATQPGTPMEDVDAHHQEIEKEA